MGLVFNVTPRPLFTLGKDPVPILYEAGWAPGPVWRGAENLALTGILSPDRPARSELVYRLSYPGPPPKKIIIFIILNIFIVLYESRHCESEEKYRKVVQLSHERTFGYDWQFGNTEIHISNTGAE